VVIEFPRCATCRVSIQPGLNVVFRPDGRVHHTECPTVVCQICSREVRPADPIRRDGEEMIHANCWIKRQRAQPVTVVAGRDGLRDLIRSRLAAGTLPLLAPTQVWGGEGNGAPCAACDKAIERSRWEVEFAGAVTVRFHVTCFSIWEQERVELQALERQREIGGGSSDLAWTLVFERRLAARAAWDRAAFDEMRIVTRELRRDSAALHARARAVRGAHHRLRTAQRAAAPAPTR